MKTKLANFTRGSQLLGHFILMFFAGFKGPLFVGLSLLIGIGWWRFQSSFSEHQAYLAWFYCYLGLLGFLGVPDSKDITLQLPSGEEVTLPLSLVRDYPPMLEAIDTIWTIVGTTLMATSVILAPLFFAFYWALEHFGAKAKAERHHRGSELVPLEALEKSIAVFNAGKMRSELTDGLGWKARIVTQADLENAASYKPMCLAGVTYPWRQELGHAMIVGTTGSGKTVVLMDLVRQARELGQRMVIFDLTGAFIESFYDPGRDHILNPIDTRCPLWDLFQDCTSESEFSAAAEALVPHDGGGSDQFWVLSARQLFVQMCMKLQTEGNANLKLLAKRLMTASLEEIHAALKDTTAGPLTSPDAARMAESIRAVFNVNAQALRLLPTKGTTFSIRKWIEDDCADGSILFLSTRYIDLAVCRPLLTLWTDMAMNRLMALGRTSDIRIWFLIDELGALHRLPALENGLQTARNYGGAIVTGVHTFAKIKSVYGDSVAITLSSLSKTKLLLQTADRDTALWCSDIIGQRQVTKFEDGYSFGIDNSRDAVSMNQRNIVEPLVLADDLKELPPLAGYIKFSGGFPAAKVEITPVNYARIAPGFVERIMKAKPDLKAAAAQSTSHNGEASAPADTQDSERATQTKSAPKATKPVTAKRLRQAKGQEPEADSKAKVEPPSKHVSKLTKPKMPDAVDVVPQGELFPEQGTANNAKGAAKKEISESGLHVNPNDKGNKEQTAADQVKRDLLDGATGKPPPDIGDDFAADL
jgi:type IV conjugative transfer system coupling protein TraD